MPVNADGGRRCTSARRLGREKAQKTRGLFSRCAADEGHTGRRRWACYDGKSAEPVWHYMKPRHPWSPDQQVWGVRERDAPPPCQSVLTRREMRRLQLPGITRPKGSPDDHPVETSFSAIPLMVLDNRPDPAVQTTPRRISQPLRRGHRRQNRWIHLPYVHGFHKDEVTNTSIH